MDGIATAATKGEKKEVDSGIEEYCSRKLQDDFAVRHSSC